MKKLFLNIIILSALAAGTILFINRNDKMNYNSNNYFVALVDKNELLEKTPSPRIIFTGASNLAFGLDSKKIEEEFNMPVVNMGLHGDFGLAFILNNVKSNIKQGDIVIISLEYFLDKIYYKDVAYATHFYPKGKDFIDYDYDYYSQKVKYYINEAQLNRQRFFNFLFEKIIRFKEAKVFVSSEVSSYDTLIYSRSAFNSNGDVISHLDRKPLTELKGKTPIVAIDYDKCIEKLNEFSEYAEQHGAKVYFTFPSYPQSEFEKNYKPIKNFESQLKENLKIPIVSTVEDFIFPDSLFFDTVYHLNKQGREQRTNKTIEILRNIINKD